MSLNSVFLLLLFTIPIASAATNVANRCRRRLSPPPLALRVTIDRLLLDRLTASRFDNVSMKTLLQTCDDILHQLIEKQKLIEFTEALRSKLKYFDELENMKNGKEFLLTDTVGFIQNLPTTVVAAFRATLEESSESSLLVHVVDISHPLAEQQIDAMDKVLSELDVASILKLMVWNKRMDPTPQWQLQQLMRVINNCNRLQMYLIKRKRKKHQ
ncbi:hypothetical protein ACSBR1_027124 [Camellia fascicularis]